MGAVQQSAAERQTAEIEANMRGIEQDLMGQLDAQIAADTQAFNDEVAFSLDRSINRSIEQYESAAFERRLIAGSEASFSSPNLSRVTRDAAKIDIEVARLNAAQAGDEVPFYLDANSAGKWSFKEASMMLRKQQDAQALASLTPRAEMSAYTPGVEASMSGYDKISLATHTALAGAGAFPVLGIVPDLIDYAYTAAEIPFGKSSSLDLGLAGVGIAATVAPVGADQAAAALKIATRSERVLSAGDDAANIVYRGLTQGDAEAVLAGQGLVAKAPDGTWTAAEHVANAGPGAGGAASNSPWISTSRRLDVAEAYDSGHGVVAIDLNKLDSLQVEVWQSAPRVNGVEGLPYHRSIWAQEVTIYKTIPPEAIVGLVPKRP